MNQEEQKNFAGDLNRLLPGVQNSSVNQSFTIEVLNYGFTVSIGCKRFAVENKERILEILQTYFNLVEGSCRNQLDDLWYNHFNGNNKIQGTEPTQVNDETEVYSN